MNKTIQSMNEYQGNMYNKRNKDNIGEASPDQVCGFNMGGCAINTGNCGIYVGVCNTNTESCWIDR